MRSQASSVAAALKMGPMRAEKIARRLYPGAIAVQYRNTARRGEMVIVHESDKLIRILRVVDLDGSTGR
jgi:hypothetical protein